MRRSIQLLAAATVVLAVGFWSSQRASATIVGEELFLRTAHWIGVREPTINRKFNAALSLDRIDRNNHSAMIDTLEKYVIPFWRKAGDRLAKIQLPSDSPNSSKLEILQDLSDGRADAYQLLDDGLRKNDSKLTATAGDDLKQVEQTANERRKAQ